MTMWKEVCKFDFFIKFWGKSKMKMRSVKIIAKKSLFFIQNIDDIYFTNKNMKENTYIQRNDMSTYIE